MIDLLSHPFMLRALIAAAVTGLAAPTIGTYLVQRRLALLGDGLGHVAVTGVAIGLFTGLRAEDARSRFVALDVPHAPGRPELLHAANPSLVRD